MSSLPPKNRIARLNIGLIVDSAFVSKYVYELAEWIQLQNDLSIHCLLISQRTNVKSEEVWRPWALLRKRLQEFSKVAVWKVIEKMEMWMLARTSYKDHLQSYDLSKAIPNSLVIQSQICDSDFEQRFSTDDVEKVRSLNLDLCIMCGSGVLVGDILTASRLGIISFYYADDQTNRGGPPGFWEVFARHEKTGFTIRQLTGESNGGTVLTRGAFLTQKYFLLNQAQLYTRSNYYMRKLLREIAQGKWTVSEEPLPCFNSLFKVPEFKIQIRYVSKLVSRKMLSVVRNHLFRKTPRWTVAFCRSNWRNLVMWRGVKLQAAEDHFLADPFVMTHDGRDYCFVEEYSYNASRACISVYELKEKSAVRLGEAIVEKFHMSFPYIFKFESKLYMVPETSANKDIRLYECVNFPLEWRLCKILMSGLSAVDTMVFEYKGLWWLFTNIDLSGITDEHTSELSIFYSRTPLTDDWIPHSKNPIFIDPSKARNAGILFDGGDVYRVNQRQGFQEYGKGFSINKISTLNPDTYREVTLCSLEPSFFQNLVRAHHLHCDGNISVFDYAEISSVN